MECRLWGCGEGGEGRGGSSQWEKEELNHQDVLHRFIDLVDYVIFEDKNSFASSSDTFDCSLTLF